MPHGGGHESTRARGLGSHLPAPFRPALVGGHGVAGICLIRLGRIRPAGLPAAGLRSENAAHRAAVCWDGPDGPVTGVYIPRRDTSSRLAALAGGRLFPGYLHCAPAGYAATPVAGVFDGVELETAGWTLHPLHLDKVASSFFDDRRRFPAGTAVPDSAFLMSGLSTVWHPQPRLRASAFAGDPVTT